MTAQTTLYTLAIRPTSKPPAQGPGESYPRIPEPSSDDLSLSQDVCIYTDSAQFHVFETWQLHFYRYLLCRFTFCLEIKLPIIGRTIGAITFSEYTEKTTQIYMFIMSYMCFNDKLYCYSQSFNITVKQWSNKQFFK